jgi:serine/threonine protein kinase
LLHCGGPQRLIHAKICDFGTARKDGPANENQALEGTLDYLPPEILDKVNIDFHSLIVDPEQAHLLEYRKSGDVYAYGVTTWEFLSERKFLADLKKEKVKTYIVSGRRVSLPARLPRWCQSMLDDCWRHNPEERLSFYDLMVLLRSKVKVYGRHLTNSRTSYSMSASVSQPGGIKFFYRSSQNFEGNSWRRLKRESFSH